ncbi:helix-turn-helix domain-containing protein [Paracoccus aminophilus]|uniref:Transcriptional regulator, AraC family n=1 Tax=Paracoccus aminophilus JCM 7686 TaxID=1367847 RepID=S5XNT0_PARAH|nr:AraC family transcriptional regulator [Paracoccus aminophilus]AGT08984.1 transcriptional regulator, AraC family [Paracoccus aminophilus JCM 7686]
MSRLRKASVAASAIQAPARRDPRKFAAPDPDAPLPANHATPPVETRPFSAKPISSLRGMVLRRLSEFSWGGAAKGIGGYATPKVCADSFIFWLTSGSIRIELPRQYRMLRAGQLIFIPAGTAFSLWHGPLAEGVVLNLPGNLLRRAGVILPRDLTQGAPQRPDLAPLRGALPRLGQIGRITDSASREAARIQFTVIARALTRLEDEAIENRNPKDDPRQAKPLMDRYLQLVRRDMGRGLTLSDFAQDLGVSSATLDRACRCCRGRSALELLYELRLERAVSLLRSSQKSATAIAAETGYVSLSHMARAFVAATGRGPEAFRRSGE